MNHHLQQSAQLTCLDGEPRACYRRWRETLRTDEALLLVNFAFDVYWLESAAPLELTALYCVCGDELAVAVTDRSLVADGLAPRQQYIRWVRRHQLLSYAVGDPIPLAPQRIAKPWGEEIWYTGVERRGVCHFGGEGGVAPIPWLQAVLPDKLAGTAGEPLVLLKILAPSALPIIGDLYFELHETKREAYVVTHIDSGAWPDGIGYMRYGFDPELRAAHSSDEAFREAYLASVLAYRKQRLKLDKLAEQGGEATREELDLEQSLRLQMERFTQLMPLRVGDVISVPPLVPHALQHGVRTVEFQTPSYERKIISFAQKVLTQRHWDTREAVPMMLLESPPIPPPAAQPGPDNVHIESVVDFPDFDVVRVHIQAGSSWAFNAGPSYRLLMVVSGTLAVSGSRYESEQALLLPHSWCGMLAVPETASALVFLLAKPRS
jgi:hypothetical protein